VKRRKAVFAEDDENNQPPKGDKGKSVSHSEALFRPTIEQESMKRTFAIILGVVVAALLGVLVHPELLAAHLSEPAPTTVYGQTPRRLWATAVVLLASFGIVIGGLAIYRAARRIGNHGRRGAIVALVLGAIGVVNGGLVVGPCNRRSRQRQRSSRWRRRCGIGFDRHRGQLLCHPPSGCHQ